MLLKSERTSAVTVGFSQSPAAVEVGLTPDPRLVGAAHIGFDLMDPAEIALFCYTAQERADRDVLTVFRIAHLNRHNIPEIFRYEIGTLYRWAFFHERDKPAQDIGPVLFHPDIHIRYGWCDTGTEDSAAESALLTGFFFCCQVIHEVPLLYSSAWG
jgi:hypothetical protein